jgi:adenylosuccinate synthase
MPYVVNIHSKVPKPAGGHAASPYSWRSTDAQKGIFEAIKDVDTKSILALDLPVGKYTETSVGDVLNEVIDNNNVMVVAGAFYGDEGKGKTVAAICAHPKVTIIARTNSGENAGHTIEVDRPNGRLKFVFHLAPSGCLEPGNKKNMIGSEAVMDPISFMQTEIEQLIKAGEYKNNVYVGNVHIVAPYHKLMDMICSPINSSTLKGMAYVHASKARKTGLRMNHLFNDEATIRRRLARDLDGYYGAMATRGMTNEDVLQMCRLTNADGVQRIPPYVMDFVTAEDKVSYLVDLYRKNVVENPNFPKCCDVNHEIRSALARGERVLLEGPQSFFLSNSVESSWESSTSASTTAVGIAACANYNIQHYKVAVINVHKAPGSSRVGIGANPTSFVPQDFFSAQGIQTLRDLPDGMCVDFDKVQKAYCAAVQPNGVVAPIEFTDATGTYNVGVAMAVGASKHWHECGATTKKPRICGLFDCVAHHECNAAQGPMLSISALDRGDDCDENHVCIAYIYHHKDGKKSYSNGRWYGNGDIIKAGDAHPGDYVAQNCYPILRRISGWKNEPLAADKRKPGSPIPKGVCEFISVVEHFTKARVISIGNGPRGQDIIYLKKQ